MSPHPRALRACDARIWTPWYDLGTLGVHFGLGGGVAGVLLGVRCARTRAFWGQMGGGGPVRKVGGGGYQNRGPDGVKWPVLGPGGVRVNEGRL